MDSVTIPDYVYTRDGQTFTVNGNGVRLVDADGTVKIDIQQELPADVVASTIVELCLAGWSPEA